MILSILTSGFSHDSEILAVGVKVFGGAKIWKRYEFPSEDRMISEFIDYFTGIDDKIVIGFNVMKFDLPLLMLRSRGLEGFGRFFRKINYANIEDLFIVLTFMNKGEIRGLEHYCRKYGIPACVSDRELVRLYETQRERFENLFRNKLDVIGEIYKRIWGRIKEE